MRHATFVLVVLSTAALVVALRPFVRLQAQSTSIETPIAWDPNAHEILIQYGLSGAVPKTWKGSIEPASAGAKVVAVHGMRFQDADEAKLLDGGSAQFSFGTRSWGPPVQQVDLSPVLAGPRSIFPNGIYAVLAGDEGARFRIRGVGDITFSLADLASRHRLSFESGEIEVESVAQPAALSAGSGEADFPSIALRPDGRVAVVWQEFSNERDRLLTREWDGANWGAAEVLETEETRDILRPSAAFDGKGQLHVLWSAQVSGNWDIYERRKTGAAWSAIERLTQTPGSDLHQRVVADPQGNLWMAWQSFRSGQSDIYLKEFRPSAGTWGEDLRVSESPANDWEPALAASANTVWVGWDSYDRGNYDIYVRPFANGQPGPVRQITSSPRFEAHASLAADGEGRLWIAYDEAEANWGKDYGYLVKTSGNPLYQSRKLRLVRLTGDRLEEPAASLETAFPLYLPRFLQNPQITIAPDGHLAVAALQLTTSRSVVEVWGVNGVWENVVFTLDGAGWHTNQILPQSSGANDARIALAGAPDGKLWAAWAADGRNYVTAQPGRQAVYAAIVPQAQNPGPIGLKSFIEQPELTETTHPHETADLQAIRNYRVHAGNAEYRIMRGDLHRHTSLSTDGVGDGSLWDFYRYALDAANLDFSTVTDHQGGVTSYNWWKVQKSSDLFLTPGRLTTLYAYERSILYPNGHRNIVFVKRGIPILPIDPAEQTGPNNPGTKRSSDAVLPYLRQYNGIAFRHTTATDQGTDWKDHDNTLEPLVEVYQGHRLNYEHEGAPRGETAEKLYTQRSGYRPAGFIWNALAKGYRIGFEAASDHCSTHISYSCILTTGSSREELVDAMRKRHSYGATDNIILDFRVRADGREYLQGDDFQTSSKYRLMVNAIGTGTIRRVALIHNERYVYQVTPGKSAVQFTYQDPQPESGENRYYVRVEQEDGNLAWSSPVWIRTK
jgi:hypothetical protein